LKSIGNKKHTALFPFAASAFKDFNKPRYAYKDQKEQIYPARIRRVEQWDNGLLKSCKDKGN